MNTIKKGSNSNVGRKSFTNSRSIEITTESRSEHIGGKRNFSRLFVLTHKAGRHHSQEYLQILRNKFSTAEVYFWIFLSIFENFTPNTYTLTMINIVKIEYLTKYDTLKL